MDYAEKMNFSRLDLFMLQGVINEIKKQNVWKYAIMQKKKQFCVTIWQGNR